MSSTKYIGMDVHTETSLVGTWLWSCVTLGKSPKDRVVIVMAALDAPRAKWEQ